MHFLWHLCTCPPDSTLVYLHGWTACVCCMGYCWIRQAQNDAHCEKHCHTKWKALFSKYLIQRSDRLHWAFWPPSCRILHTNRMYVFLWDIHLAVAGIWMMLSSLAGIYISSLTLAHSLSKVLSGFPLLTSFISVRFVYHQKYASLSFFPLSFACCSSDIIRLDFFSLFLHRASIQFCCRVPHPFL